MSKNNGPWDRRRFMSVASKACGAAALCAGAGPLELFGASKKKPPNIVIILADDMGYGDLGCYGSEALCTPNIDRMASEGARMTDFYSSSPVCSPSRAGLLTGRYPPRTGIVDVLFPTDTLFGAGWAAAKRLPEGLPLDEITMAEALKPLGYSTCCVGKWHLGNRKRYRPHHRGFDRYFGPLYSNDMKPFELYHNDEVVERHPADQTQLTRKYTEFALSFLNENGDNPFLLYMPHTFPHEPLHASDRFKRKSNGGLYGDVVEEVDWSVGQVLEALEKRGIADNTLVFFTSDNGPWYQGSTGGARGRKAETLEGGMRVPGIARWPGMIPAGRVIEAPAMNIDLFSTTLAVAGSTLPSDRVIDGKNLMPLLGGMENESPHEALFLYSWNRDLEGVRVGRWKYFRSRRLWMYPPIQKGPWLIDTERDPYESYNAIDKYPNIAAKLEKTMVDWEKNFDRGINGK